MKYKDLLYILAMVPGLSIAQEAPFKLTREYLNAQCQIAADTKFKEIVHVTLFHRAPGESLKEWYLTIKCKDEKAVCHVVSAYDIYSGNKPFSCAFDCPKEDRPPSIIKSC